MMIEGIGEYIESRKYDFKKIKIKYTHDEKNAINYLLMIITKIIYFYIINWYKDMLLYSNRKTQVWPSGLRRQT